MSAAAIILKGIFMTNRIVTFITIGFHLFCFCTALLWFVGIDL